jgi:uncharacterized protein YecT (DUF1311 family)
MAGAHAQAQPASNPSFDCRKAATPVEKLICSDPMLGDLDRQMAEAWRQAFAQASVDSREALLKRQLRWLQDRAIGCGLDPRQPGFHTLAAPSAAECLSEMYARWRQDMLERPTGWRPPRRTEYPFEAKRLPFLPRLLVNRDAQLCDAFLNGLRRDFLSRHRDEDGLLNEGRPFKDPPMTVGHWVAWPSEHGSKATGQTIDVAELDLDRDGRKQLLLHVTRPFNWRANNYSLLVRSRTGTDGLEDEINDFMKSWPQNTPTLSYVRAAPGPWRIDGFESPVKMLSYRGGIYLYGVKDGITGVGAVEPRDGTATLSRLHADGSSEVRCQVSVAPRAGALPLRWPPDSPDTLAVPAEAVDWMQTIREIQGNEGPMAGSLHALDRTIIYSSYTWHDALVRPWEVAAARPPLQPPPLFMRAWIHQWGYQSLSRFRLARTFEARRLAAIDALARYYARAFGVPNARQAASLITDRIISASFVVHIDNVPSDAELQRQIRGSDGPGGNLRAALLVGSPPDVLQALLKDGPLLSGDRESGIEGREPALFYALEHPDEVRLLLDNGVDINEGNVFGKTALMYAAQYDLDDTVTLLLARGADVARHTVRSQQTMIHYSDRTALMYAAENASEPVIRTLIQAGADTCAIDTGSRDIANYLSRNRRLSESERARLAALIAADQPCDR